MRVLLIDSLNIIRRVYEAASRDENNHNLREHTVSSSLSSIKRALNETQPTHVLCCFDADGPNWRHEVYSDYKGNRNPTPIEVKQAVSDIEQFLQKAGISTIKVAGLEADDLIGIVARRLDARKISTTILSSDKDFNQLISEHVTVKHHFKNEVRDVAWVKETYGVHPNLFRDVLSFIGDTADNIPGVPGIGPQKAAQLVNRFGSVEDILSYAYALEGKLGALIRKYEDKLRLSYELVGFREDVELGLNLKDMVWRPV